MNNIRTLLTFMVCFCVVPAIFGNTAKKTRIFIVDSYNKEYLWSQDTNDGVCKGFLEFGYFDGPGQKQELVRNDFVETSRAVVKKAWLDTKRRDSKSEIMESTVRIVQEIKDFKPDAILLGDDNACNYIGNQFIDTSIPICVWGMDVTPLKYGLVDSIEKPGHNVTGTYQTFYFKETLEFLKALAPGINSFAILSDDSESGHCKMKRIQQLAQEGKLPLKLVEAVATNSFTEWKTKSLELQNKVDAFFIVNHNTLRDDNGRRMSQLEVGAWYLRNIKKPECGPEKQFVAEGILCAVDDSGVKQGYYAVKALSEILTHGKDPATLPCLAPSRGALIVNRERAKMLGIKLTGNIGIEQYLEKSLALEKTPEDKSQ